MTIRRYRYTDLADTVVLAQCCYPNMLIGLENSRYWEDKKRNEMYEQSFVALEGDKLIGQGTLTSCDIYMVEPDIFYLDLMVDPDFQGQGIARKLHELLTIHCGYLRWNKLQSGCSSDEKVAQRWLGRLDYRHIETVRKSRLELADYSPPADHDTALARMEEQNIRLVTYGELDDPDKEKKLWRLSEIICHDMPGNDEYQPSEFDEWKRRASAPSRRLGENLLALSGDEFIGITTLCFPAGDGTPGVIGITGTLAPYRGKGIATALKYASIDRAAGQGIPAILTGNEENNEAILRINNKLGFKPIPDWLGYELINENYSGQA